MADEQWMTKKEAGELLGLTPRSVERYAAKGQLAAGKRQAKHGYETVYTAESVHALKAALNAPPSDVVMTQRQSPTNLRAETVVVEMLRSLSERMLLTDGRPTQPGVDIADKLTLSLKEAAALAGYSQDFLMIAIRAGVLVAKKRARKWNIKREDLEAWVKGL